MQSLKPSPKSEPYKFNQICLLSHENFCLQSMVLYQNYELFYWRNRHDDVFQITPVFVVYEHEKTVNFQ